jgi:hypothetical protein
LHLPENCCKIAFEFNVQQHNAINNLIDCWIESYKAMLNELKTPKNNDALIKDIYQWWNNTPKKNGNKYPSEIIRNGKKILNPEYNYENDIIHLPKIIHNLLKRYKMIDKTSKRNPITSGIFLDKFQMFEKLIKQNFKCYYSGITFSKNRNSWNFFSLERLNNSLNHSDENTVFICRMFNTSGQLNRKKILTALLSQIYIPLSEEDTTIINIELNKENKIL